MRRLAQRRQELRQQPPLWKRRPLRSAKLGILNPKLMEAVAAQALDLIEDFNAQNFGNTVWAYAKLGILNPKLMAAIAAQVLDLIGEVNAQNLAHTVLAYATLGV